MALDIHKYINGSRKDLVYQIDDKIFSDLYAAFTDFENFSGQEIDPYGDLIISTYLCHLIAAIQKYHPHHELLKILRPLAEKHEAVILVGD